MLTIRCRIHDSLDRRSKAISWLESKESVIEAPLNENYDPHLLANYHRYHRHYHPEASRCQLSQSKYRCLGVLAESSSSEDNSNMGRPQS